MGNHYAAPSVAFDFDGTLCEDTRQQTPGRPRWPMVRLARRLHETGWWVVVNSARPLVDHLTVESWLQEHNVPCSQIALSAKPPVDVYIDDKGLMLPPAAMEEYAWMRAATAPLAATWAGETRKTSFRRAMADCAENPDWSGADFDEALRVVVPMSGGLDSSTLWAMACEADLPAVPVYVDNHAPYTGVEIERARRLTGGQLRVLSGPPVAFKQFQHIQVGRNMIMLWTVAGWARDHDWWGELWFGNHAEETKLVGGDKSVRFLATAQHLLTAAGHDLRLVSPLGGLTKPDLVRWWAARDRLDEALSTYTCFTGRPEHCGRCWACMQRLLAFTVAGHRAECEATFPGGIDLSVPAAKYWSKKTARASGGLRTGRATGTDEALTALGYGPDILEHA
ncbi:7-cyano-7-deazaguanine synthase [Actinomadura violacea]|uniref:7-cyano-7-deazaguanine synthase n=1 Tax=Actinomadura violacea TaxID=2819934 RepID=A0ABS3RXV4_9ACTN|nr:7-cyano-7-deazaguanine synthase [Actinomadura violacea]MBO2461594.1 7-cyano-7-deazaguanine synthase [Actinomadura violacea]